MVYSFVYNFLLFCAILNYEAKDYVELYPSNLWLSLSNRMQIVNISDASPFPRIHQSNGSTTQ